MKKPKRADKPKRRVGRPLGYTKWGEPSSERSEFNVTPTAAAWLKNGGKKLTREFIEREARISSGPVEP